MNDKTPSHAPRIRGVRGGIEDVIIVPLVVVALAINKFLRFIFSILIDILDYAFPLLIQIFWLPLLAARIVGDAIVAALKGVVGFLPLPEMKRRNWLESIRRNWAWLRQKISYRAFEHAVHVAFEGGMAWVFRRCRHLTPNTALLVLLGAVLWLPISFGAATALHAILFAKVAEWPAWVQLLHPLATIIAKSKLLVLPVYPAAWPQAKKHSLIQAAFASYRAIKDLYLVRKTGFRYRQTERAGTAVVDRLERVTGFTSAVRWFRRAHVAEHLGVEKPSQKMRLFWERWSIKFSAEYYEAKEREAAANHALHKGAH